MTQPAESHIEHMEWWKRWKLDGAEEAKRALIELYIPLVDRVVRRIAIGLPRTVATEELQSHGMMGLMDAIEKFNLQRGLQFETYATWRIRGAIIDGMRQADWVPRSVRDKAKNIEEAYSVLEQQYMRSVSDAEISAYLNVSEQEFQQMLYDVSITAIGSLEDPIKEENQESRMNLLIDEQAYDPAQTVNDQHRKEALALAIERLTERERTVISLFYYEELSVSEIAEVMSLTPSRISQLHTRAILRLRGVMEHERSLLMDN